MKLYLCSGCDRHVRESDEACPFCGASARSPLVCDPSRRAPRMSRAALVGGVGAAAALLMANCSNATYGGPYPPNDGGYVQPDTSVEDVRDGGDAPHDAPVDAPSEGAADAASDVVQDAADGS